MTQANMTLANPSAETHAAIDMLCGEIETAAEGGTSISLAVVAAAAAKQLQRDYEGALDNRRLTDAMALLIRNGVALYLDDSSTVQSNDHVYRQQDRVCSCPDHQHRRTFCKHLMAVDLYRRARVLLHGEPASKLPAPPITVPDPPASALWDVKEAPVSVCLKLRFGRGEVTYTMRAVTDAEAEARVQTRLDFIDRLEDEYQSRQAEKARVAAIQAAPAKTSTQTENSVEAAPVENRVQPAMQQAMDQTAAQNGSSNKPPAASSTTQETAAYDNDEGGKWCFLHKTSMPERSNASGFWHSHPAEDETGPYYCKGKGRPRRGNA